MTAIPVRTQNLTTVFGRHRALDQFTFEVPEGAVFALIGANGAGKTTAIKTILNIVPPRSGVAEVFGTSSRRLGPAEFARIGYVSEDQDLPDWMTVQSFLRYTRQFYPAWDDAAAATLIRRLELPLDRYLSALSRGMKVKAALAAALPYTPDLIVLDEPFSGLDGLVREQVLECILDRMEGAAVLVASHDLAEIETCATHVAYLREGTLVFTEEIGSLSARFREVEVTFDHGAEWAAPLPAEWLNVSRAGHVVRFVDSAYSEGAAEREVRSRFTGVRDVVARAMPLRGIFVALERARAGEVIQ